MIGSFADLSKQPLRLENNRVWRLYSGGKCLEEWQGSQIVTDNDYPEEWVASTITAKNVGREHITEGLSQIKLNDGSKVTLKELIESDPASFLGRKHAGKYGASPAVLVKLLDAGERLTVQVHPDKGFALQNFGSPFGKTESWYVLGGRSIGGVDPYVLLGFKQGITKEKWRQLFEKQDIAAMINSLHKIPIQEEDVFFIEAGVPHAIGGGCFLIEVQEPTDYTLRVERSTQSGRHIPDSACHLGLGLDKMMDCFRYNGFSYEETIRRWKKKPKVIREEIGGREINIIGSNDTDRFLISRFDVSEELTYRKLDTFCIVIILSGKGKLVWEEGQYEIKSSDQLFLPAGIDEIKWINTSTNDLKILSCSGPNNL